MLIVADDLGVNDLGCYGRKDHSTPHLDRLAAQGLRFTQSYAAQSVCSPTRAALMTGQSPARLHLTTFLPGRPDACSQLLLHPAMERQLPQGVPAVAEDLKSRGYACGYFGKWHLGQSPAAGPKDRGFDVYVPGHADTQPGPEEGGKGEFELTRAAEAFLDDHHDDPFFLYVAHNTPHIPLAARPELIERHKNAFNPTYAAMIASLDECVGRLVAKIDALGLGEQTLIVFTSDNGGLHVPEGRLTPPTHNSPYRAGKGFCYEGGLRTPCIARWTNRVAAGPPCDQPVISMDWAATLRDLGGAKQPTSSDGLSLRPILEGKTLAPRPFFWHLPHYTNQGGRPAGAVRMDNWKLIEHYEDGRCELFDLARDPGEATDRAADHPAMVAQLRGRLEAWRRDVGAQGNLANPEFRAAPWKELYAKLDASRLVAGERFDQLDADWQTWQQAMNRVVNPSKQAEAGCLAPEAGAVILEARLARVHGTKLRYEPEPHKDTLGYWVQREDWADWEFELPHAGEFVVEVLQGCGTGSGGAEVEIAIQEQTCRLQVEETGHFQRFVPREAGHFRFDQPGRYTLSLKALTKPRGAVMDVRRIVLRPSG